MKKSAFLTALLLLGMLTPGCPVYDDEGCFSDHDCAYGSVCDGHTGQCVGQFGPEPEEIACHRPSDCGANETCGRSGICSIGDCHFASVGCVRGYECSPDSGRWQCVKLDSASAGGNGGDGGDANGGTSALAGTGGAG